jgi:hypothetical protein
MISADFGGGDQRIVARLSSLISPVLDAMVNAMDAQMISLEGYIRANKLEGNPLQHRSGRLQSSVNYVPATIVDDTTVEGSVNGGGGLAPYGIVHEEGGTFQIPEYTRRSARSASGGVVRLLTKGGLTSQRRQINFVRTDIVVHAHPATYPQRSFMRAGLDEQSANILENLQTAYAAAILEAYGVQG